MTGRLIGVGCVKGWEHCDCDNVKECGNAFPTKGTKMGGILNPGVHKPFNDDGVTYCGWWGGDGIHGGCGHIWPCPHWLQGETGEDVTG